MRQRRAQKIRPRQTLQQRIEKHAAKIALFENRPGPERRKGEKAGEYSERVKHHERTTENQILLAGSHREVLERRLTKAKRKA